MYTFSFKYYPGRLLIAMVLGFAVLFGIARQLLTAQSLSYHTIVWPVVFSSTIAFTFMLINRFAMWSWYLKLLNLADLRGKYTGTLVSSFFVDDDPAKANIKMTMKMEIAQNLNGIRLFGKVSPPYDNQHTSSFQSEHTNLSPLENGCYLLEYRYSNTSNKSHGWDKKYTLTSHTGWAMLVFNPTDKTMEGQYTTYENNSRGYIKLQSKKK